MRPRTILARTLAAPALLFALGLAACGGGDGGSDTGSDLANATISPGAKVIDQDRLAFNPSELVVGVGEDVTYTNSETALHTVTINGKNESGIMRKGDVFTWKAPERGEYTISCDFHPQMKATVLAR